MPVADAPNVWYETTVHILVSFCGNNYVTTEKMAPYLRSLLWHRSCKIHFHVLADRGAWKDTKALFKQEASRFPQVEYTFLPREENDAWIQVRDLAWTFAGVAGESDSRGWGGGRLQRANDLQRNLQFPTSLPGCSFVRIWVSTSMQLARRYHDGTLIICERRCVCWRAGGRNPARRRRGDRDGYERRDHPRRHR